MTQSSPRSSPTLVAAVLLAVAFLATNYKLTLGLAVPRWDADRYYAPLQMLVADHARAGTFLIWNPWLNSGSPDYADPQVPAFSPLAIGLGLVTGGTELGFRVYWLAVWFLGGLGVFLLGRHLAVPLWGCYVVALGFMFSGFYTGHAEHTSTLYTISSLGFVIWRLDVALSRRRLLPAIEAGVVWGLSALGGYPGWVFLNGCFAALWAAGRLLFPAAPDGDRESSGTATLEVPTRTPTVRFGAVAVATLLVVGLLVLSPTYAAFLYEAPGYTDRSEPLARHVAVRSNPLHPGALTTFASPYLSILKLDNRDLWAYTDVSTASVYLGPIVPVLALLSLISKPGDRWRWWIAAVGAVFLLTAFGQTLPLRGWLYDLLPPMRYFRHAGFLRGYAMFAVVVLALLGSRDLTLASRRVPSALSVRFAVAAAILSVSALSAYHTTMAIVGHPGQHPGSAQLHVWLVWLAICGVGLAYVATAADNRLRLACGLLVALALADASFTVYLSQRTMWLEDSRFKARWDRLTNEHVSSFDLTPRGLQRDLRAPEWPKVDGAPHNKNLPLKIPALESYVGFNNRFFLDFVQRPILSAMATDSNRFWCSSGVVSVAPSDAAYTAFVRRSEDLRRGVLVVHPRDQLTANGHATSGDAIARIAELPAATPATVRLEIYRPHELTFEANCPAKGWLLVTDRWSRGWQATVNGQPAEVWGGNFVFRALMVEAGTNDIRFTYHPVGFPALVILSWSVAFVTVACSVYNAIREKRGQTLFAETAGKEGL